MAHSRRRNVRIRADLGASSFLGLLVIEHFIWWGRHPIKARAKIPALAAGLALGTITIAMITSALTRQFYPSHISEVLSWVRIMLMFGVFVAYLSHLWWRTGRST